LGEQFGVSSTPIRDALMRLEEEGLVEVFPQYATVVSRIDIGLAQQAHFLRQALELEIVKRLALEHSERLVDEFGGDEIPCNDLLLAINTVDAHTGHIVRFVNAETPLTRPPDYNIVESITVDMVLASASIPLLFPPVQVGQHLLWDGGLLVNTPLAPVVALGADEIVTILVTEPPDPERGRFPHFGRAVERMVDTLLENAYNVDRKLLLERNRLAHLDRSQYRAVKLYDAVRPARDACFNAGSYLFFERGVLAAMQAAGRRSATAWLAAGPRVDHLEEPATGAAA